MILSSATPLARSILQVARSARPRAAPLALCRTFTCSQSHGQRREDAFSVSPPLSRHQEKQRQKRDARLRDLIEIYYASEDFFALPSSCSSSSSLSTSTAEDKHLERRISDVFRNSWTINPAPNFVNLYQLRDEADGRPSSVSSDLVSPAASFGGRAAFSASTTRVASLDGIFDDAPGSERKEQYVDATSAARATRVTDTLFGTVGERPGLDTLREMKRPVAWEEGEGDEGGR